MQLNPLYTCTTILPKYLHLYILRMVSTATVQRSVHVCTRLHMPCAVHSSHTRPLNIKKKVSEFQKKHTQISMKATTVTAGACDQLYCSYLIAS